MRSPLENFSYFYFIGGLAFVLAIGYLFDRAVAKFIAAGWLAVGIALALILIGARHKATNEVSHFVYLLGFAWLALLLVAGVVVLWFGGIGVPELEWLTR